MAEHRGSPAGDNAPSFAQSLKNALAALSAMLHTRLELFVTELEEERERLRQTLVLTLLSFFGLSLGFILLTIFLVALFWERGWRVAIGGLTALYLAIGIGAALKLRQKILSRSRLFPDTLAELGKDSDQLRGSRRE
jgi:uncharacterized membrane protein YqjE